MSETSDNQKMLLLSQFMWLGSTILLLSCEDESYFEVRHDGPRLNVEPSVKFDNLDKADDLYYSYIQLLLTNCSRGELHLYMQQGSQVYDGN